MSTTASVGVTAATRLSINGANGAAGVTARGRVARGAGVVATDALPRSFTLLSSRRAFALAVLATGLLATGWLTTVLLTAGLFVVGLLSAGLLAAGATCLAVARFAATSSLGTLLDATWLALPLALTALFGNAVFAAFFVVFWIAADLLAACLAEAGLVGIVFVALTRLVVFAAPRLPAAACLAGAFLTLTFLATTFLALAFLFAVLLALVFLETAFLAAAFLMAVVLPAAFFAGALLLAAFLATVFFASAFLATAFVAGRLFAALLVAVVFLAALVAACLPVRFALLPAALLRADLLTDLPAFLIAMPCSCRFSG
nr:hypothetical protein [Lysobacter antibioticus]